MLFLALISLLGCTNPGAARHALQNQGFTNIQITGYAPFSCGEDDTSSTGFTADNPHGDRVSGVVCCGLMKNCTIRW